MLPLAVNGINSFLARLGGGPDSRRLEPEATVTTASSGPSGSAASAGIRSGSASAPRSCLLSCAACRSSPSWPEGPESDSACRPEVSRHLKAAPGRPGQLLNQQRRAPKSVPWGMQGAGPRASLSGLVLLPVRRLFSGCSRTGTGSGNSTRAGPSRRQAASPAMLAVTPDFGIKISAN